MRQIILIVSLHLRNEADLMVVNNIMDVFVNLVFKYFIESVCVYTCHHSKISLQLLLLLLPLPCPLPLLLLLTAFWFWCKDNNAFMDIILKCLLCFEKQLEAYWCQFFENLAEFWDESTWIQAFAF